MSFSFTNGLRLRPIEIHRNTPTTPWTYLNLDQRQREIAESVREGSPGTLLLSEVAPVITRGRRTPDQDILKANVQEGSPAPVYVIDRGGLATYHGPGQWILFPVDSLQSLTGDPRGVRKIVCTLLEIAQTVGRRYRPEAEIRHGAEMGVWSARGKFAAVGIHVERGILLHGLAINGLKTAQSFQGLRPCGLDAPVDFLLNGQGEVEFLALGAELAEEAQKVLGK